ncbi:MAG: oligosaccharide flippase family protein [Planctomycetes bacterium]|nr:oligosaccharide flippase family protein [Planctomycetota bacterium]
MPEAEPSRPPDAPAGAGPTALARRRGLRFVLLAHPTVQGLRFLSKLVLAWFLTSEDLGEAVFASLFALVAAQLAIFGLDEALVQAPRLDAQRWRLLRRWSARAGLLAASGLAVVGLVVHLLFAGLGDHPLLGTLLFVLAPMVWIANRSVLPAALLVRAGDYKSVFLLDLAQVLALTVGTWIPAALGLGPFSLIFGWYANAIAAVVLAERAARRHVPPDHDEPELDPVASTTLRRFARALCLASLSSFGVERLDGLAVGARLGRAALGAYELAQQLSTAALGYASNLVERLVFPVLADEERERNLAGAWREALRIVLVFLLPLHVLLALVGEGLVDAAFPARWAPAGALVPWLALGAGARVLDLVASAALKAGGRGRAVSWLGAARLAFLPTAVGVGLQGGLLDVARCVCAARVLSAFASTAAALARFGTAPDAAGRRTARAGGAFAVFAAWSALACVVAFLARGALAPIAYVAVVVAAGAAAWLLLRLVADRAEVARELAWLRTRATEARG